MMSSKRPRKSLGQRIKDHIFFSVVVMTAFFVMISLMGIKAKFASLVFSILFTLALNVALSYYYEWQNDRTIARARENTQPDADIRFRN